MLNYIPGSPQSKNIVLADEASPVCLGRFREAGIRHGQELRDFINMRIENDVDFLRFLMTNIRDVICMAAAIRLIEVRDAYFLGHLPCLYLPAKNPVARAAKPRHRYFNVSMIICDVLITHF